MNDFRREINEVFAKQQGQLGDAAGTGNRMLRAATAGRRGHRQLSCWWRPQPLVCRWWFVDCIRETS
jgi:hypothetical protein